MNVKQVLSELARLGTAQNRKVYARHGYPEPMAGVSFAHLKELRRRLGTTDHDLARGLLATRHADAQVLGAMLVDPAAVTAADARGWVEGARWAGLVSGLADALAAAPGAVAWSRAWMKDGREQVRRAGYALLGCMLRDGRDDVDDAWLAKVLATIERDLHGSPNDAREAMNGALIAIGGWRPALTKAALAVAERLGPVELDHGETSCRTAVATDYIRKMRARAAEVKPKRPAKEVAEQARPRPAAKQASRKAPARRSRARSAAARGGRAAPGKKAVRKAVAR